MEVTEFTCLKLEKYFLIRSIECSSANGAWLYIGPVDSLRHWIEVDGNWILWLTGDRQLEYRTAVQRHLEQLSLWTVNEE